jgi:hypothetical protein
MLTDYLLCNTGKIPKNSKKSQKHSNFFYYGQVFVFDTIQKEELFNTSLELFKENPLSYSRKANNLTFSELKGAKKEATAHNF